MSFELVVGPIRNPEKEAAAQAWLGHCLGKAAPKDWNTPGEEERIPVPDFMAVMALRDHASALEGLEGIGDTFAKSRFTHLPAGPWHLWLPVDFAESRFPLLDVKIGPVTLGSAVRLKAELAEVRRLSREKGPALSPAVDSVISLLETAAEKAISRKTVLRGFT